MVSTSHPKRGRGRRRRKKKKHKQSGDKPKSFDWDTASSKSGHMIGGKYSNSAFIFFLVPDITIWTPPGSGTGLIPLCLPRQERMVNQELTQINSLQRGMLASVNSSLALSIYDIQISSDYRLFRKILSSFSKKTSLPVYWIVILYSSNHFLLLSPGPSFFPCPTFQNQTTNLIPSRLHPYDAVILDARSNIINLQMLITSPKTWPLQSLSNICLLYTSDAADE